MKRIFKYAIPIEDEFELELPKGAEILTFQTQYGQPCIWAIINPDAKKEKRYFNLYGTGHPILVEELSYIGTAQVAHGQLVWHLFESK